MKEPGCLLLIKLFMFNWQSSSSFCNVFFQLNSLQAVLPKRNPPIDSFYLLKSDISSALSSYPVWNLGSVSAANGFINMSVWQYICIESNSQTCSNLKVMTCSCSFIWLFFWVNKKYVFWSNIFWFQSTRFPNNENAIVCHSIVDKAIFLVNFVSTGAKFSFWNKNLWWKLPTVFPKISSHTSLQLLTSINDKLFNEETYHEVFCFTN